MVKALGFLSVVVKMGSHKQLFEAQQTLEDFCRLIILPNMTIRGGFVLDYQHDRLVLTHVHVHTGSSSTRGGNVRRRPHGVHPSGLGSFDG